MNRQMRKQDMSQLEFGEHPADAALETWQAGSGLRNTCWLLGLCLFCALLSAALALLAKLPHPGLVPGAGGAMALLYLTWRTRHSPAGLPACLALAAFNGYTLAPLLAQTLALPHGQALVLSALIGALGLTAVLGAYVLATRRDFSYLGGYVSIGIVAAFLAGMAGNHYGLELMTSIAATSMAVLMPAVILHQVSAVVTENMDKDRRQGESYIMHAAGLFLSINLLVPSLAAAMVLDTPDHNPITAVLGIFVAIYAIASGLIALFNAGEQPSTSASPSEKITDQER